MSYQLEINKNWNKTFNFVPINLKSNYKKVLIVTIKIWL
jgi:hypothetical protein